MARMSLAAGIPDAFKGFLTASVLGVQIIFEPFAGGVLACLSALRPKSKSRIPTQRLNPE